MVLTSARGGRFLRIGKHRPGGVVPPSFLGQREGFREHAVVWTRSWGEVRELVFGTFAVYLSRRSAMDSNKPAQNIQDSFLNTARKERLSITIYLLSGVKLTGRIRSFDKYSVVLEANGQEQLIFKHAISTIVMGRVAATHVAHVAQPPEKAVSAGAAAAPVAAASASGTEG